MTRPTPCLKTASRPRFRAASRPTGMEVAESHRSAAVYRPRRAEASGLRDSGSWVLGLGSWNNVSHHDASAERSMPKPQGPRPKTLCRPPALSCLSSLLYALRSLPSPSVGVQSSVLVLYSRVDPTTSRYWGLAARHLTTPMAAISCKFGQFGQSVPAVGRAGGTSRNCRLRPRFYPFARALNFKKPHRGFRFPGPVLPASTSRPGPRPRRSSLAQRASAAGVFLHQQQVRVPLLWSQQTRHAPTLPACAATLDQRRGTRTSNATLPINTLTINRKEVRAPSLTFGTIDVVRRRPAAASRRPPVETNTDISPERDEYVNDGAAWRAVGRV
jgi:hypothetical protein